MASVQCFQVKNDFLKEAELHPQNTAKLLTYRRILATIEIDILEEITSPDARTIVQWITIKI